MTQSVKDLVSSFDISSRIFKLITNSVIDAGGSYEDLRRVETDEALRREIGLLVAYGKDGVSNKLKYVCRKMVESALAHDHAYGNPVEIHTLRFHGTSHMGGVIGVEKVTLTATVGDRTFSCVCTVSAKGNEKFEPQSIELKDGNGMVAVIGESRIDTDEFGKQVYVTRT
jgi:hypothetical protein